MFLKNSQNPQENTCASFLIKLETEACNSIKKEILVQVFSCEFCEISKNTFFYGTPLGDSFCCLTDLWKYYLAITAQILRMMKAYCHNNQSAGKNSIAIDLFRKFQSLLWFPVRTTWNKAGKWQFKGETFLDNFIKANQI